MTPSYNNSIVVITPIAMEDVAVAMARAMGFDASFSQVASASGEAPFTHKYMHTWGQDLFRDQITGASPIQIDGYTQEQIAGLLGNLIIDTRAGGHAWQHVQEVLSAAGLMPEKRGGA